MVTGDDDRRGDDTVRPTEDGAEDRRLLMAPHLRGLEPVSYTHLTLPTIYSV